MCGVSNQSTAYMPSVLVIVKYLVLIDVRYGSILILGFFVDGVLPPAIGFEFLSPKNTDVSLRQ